MTPANSWEVLSAKIVPLFVLLMGDVVLAVLIARGVFAVPFRGIVLLYLVLAGLYVFPHILARSREWLRPSQRTEIG